MENARTHVEQDDGPTPFALALNQEAAHTVDAVCRMIRPEPTNTAIARRLSDILGVKVTRQAMAKWRRGQTPVSHRTVLALCQLAGMEWHVELEHLLD